MRKIVFYMIMLLASSLMANEIHWAKDFNSGVAEAKKEHKPVMFLFSRHTCKYCIILKKTTLSDERVIKKLNKNFISIVSYTDDNDYTPRELWRPGTPSTWFLLSNGKPMYQPIVGAIDAKKFLNALDVVKTQFDNLKKSGK